MGWSSPSNNPLFRILDRYGRPHARSLAVGLGAKMLGRVPDALPKLVFGIAIDAVFLSNPPYRLPLVPDAWIPTGRWEQFLLTIGIFATAAVATTVLDYVSSIAMGRFSMEFQHDVRTGVYDTVQRLEMGYFDDRETGDVMSVLNDDVRELNRFIYGVIDRLVGVVVGLGVTFAYLLWLNWQLSLLLALVLPLLAAISYAFSVVMEEKHLAIRERVGELNARLNANVSGIAVIKSFGTEDREAERVRAASSRHRDAKWDAHKTQTSTDPAMRGVTNLASAVVLLVGSYWVLFGAPPYFSGSLTPGALYVFFSYVFGFVSPMQAVVSAIDAYQNGKAAATRLTDAIEDEDRREGTGGADLADPDGAVAYDDVRFTYEGRDEPALDGVSFAVDPGSTVGIVGPTGAGKSTLLKLLFRFYDPDDGTVTVDGADVREYSLASLRRSIGYVSQDPFLFHGTVRENVAYASPGVGDDAVERAARLAGAHEFVTDLPDGYETTVGDRGVKLSGGQRQRIAIARAIVRDPRILVFDEATSHVDNETEALIQHAMESVGADRTTFVVAHRLSTVRNADEILVLDGGEIAERGSHEDLLEADGLYADLWRIQVGAVEGLPDEFLAGVDGGDCA